MKLTTFEQCSNSSFKKTVNIKPANMYGDKVCDSNDPEGGGLELF